MPFKRTNHKYLVVLSFIIACLFFLQACKEDIPENNDIAFPVLFGNTSDMRLPIFKFEAKDSAEVKLIQQSYWKTQKNIVSLVDTLLVITAAHERISAPKLIDSSQHVVRYYATTVANGITNDDYVSSYAKSNSPDTILYYRNESLDYVEYFDFTNTSGYYLVQTHDKSEGKIGNYWVYGGPDYWKRTDTSFVLGRSYPDYSWEFEFNHNGTGAYTYNGGDTTNVVWDADGNLEVL